MKLFYRIVSSAVLSVNILLLFFLFFQDRVVFPSWIQSIGRMHPLLLHLPIGAIVVLLLVVFFRKEFKEESFEKIMVLVISVASGSAALSALMGFVLSKEGGYSETLLSYHLIAGTVLSFLLWGLLAAIHQQKFFFNALLTISFVALLITGHLGASITHGENFVWAPLMMVDDKIPPITDSTSLYHAAIEPVLRQKCFSCHNEHKTKGNLLMTSVASITAGGKHGALWKAHDPKNSLLIERINLAEDNDEHMPPAGKTPLSEKEKQLFYRWIQEGADVKKAWTRFDKKDTLMMVAKEFIHLEKKDEQVKYSFDFASKEKIKALNSPYRTVTQLSLESPGLTAEFFVSQQFNANSLKELEAVKEQLISLSLAGMPVTDADANLISEFKNLEKLNLNNTKVTGAIFGIIKNLKKLKILSLAGTAIDAKSLQQISTLPELKEVFIWNTAIDKNQLTELQKLLPKVTWNVGYPSDEVLRLTPPLLVNDSLLIKQDQHIQLKHNLPGTIIRYTLDGTTPDSLKGLIYKEPIDITGFTVLKAIAFRNEWWSSKVVEFVFFKSGYKPSTAELIVPPDKQYKGEGIKTLIDNKKSTPDNFREPYWIGYREKPLEALFSFEKKTHLKTITVSYAKNYYYLLAQPESIELWAGHEKNQLKLIDRINPALPKQGEASNGMYAIIFTLPKEQFQYYKIVGKSISKLPDFISKKRERGWFFVDEVIFN